MRSLVVDSCVHIDRLRAGEDIRQELLPYLRSGSLYNCGVIRAEVLRGLKTPGTRDGMEAFFDIIPEIPCDAKLWRHVSALGWQLGRQGKWPPLADLAIAACCLRVGATLLTTDAHFRDVPGLTVTPVLPA